MIRPEPFTVDGRAGVLVFLDKDLQPVEPSDPDAVVARAVFDDGGTAVYRVPPPTPQARDYRERLRRAFVLEDNWDESLHPRDEEGKFAESGGGGGGGAGGGSGGEKGQLSLFEHDPLAGSEAALRNAAKDGFAKLDPLLKDAVANAEYEGTEAEEWDQLDSDVQDHAMQKWEEGMYEDSSVNEAGWEAGDAWINDELTPETLFDKVMESDFQAWIEQHNIDPETVDFAEGSAHHPYAIGRHEIELDTAALRTTDGEELPEALVTQAQTAFNNNIDSAREALTDELRESDGYSEAVSEAERDVINDAWNNLSDSERFSAASDAGLISSVTLEAGEPKTWKWDGSNSDEDYQRTHAIARELTNVRTAQLLEERGLGPLPGTFDERPGYHTGYSAGERAIQIPSELWSAWKTNSQSPLGNAMQMAVAAEMGTLPTPESEDPAKGLTPNEKSDAVNALIETFTTSAERDQLDFEAQAEAGGDPSFASVAGKGKAEDLAMGRAKAYVRAQWETTQYVMDKAGQDTVDVYRAVILPKDEVLAEVGLPPTTSKYTDIRDIPPALPLEYVSPTVRPRDPTGSIPLPNLKLLQNAVASTTAQPDVANEWRGAGGVSLDSDHKRVVIRFRAPRTAVFSVPVFGQNVEEESELVLMGTKGLQWDAWMNEAPLFTDKPLGHTLARDKPPSPKKPLVVNLHRQVPGGHWLKNWRPYKEHPLPKRPPKKFTSAYRDTLLLDWEEGAHPRDEAGRFAGDGSDSDTPREEQASSIPAGKKGECFRNAKDWVREHDDFDLVHGKVTNADGRTFDHAWAESTKQVADPTTGVRMGKERWYATTNAKAEAKYNAEQAAINMLRTGNLGPWTDEEVGHRKLKLSAFALDWEEDLHPRDESGKFAESGGGGKSFATQQEARGGLQDAVGHEIPVGVDDHPTAIHASERVATVLEEMRAKGYEMPTEIEVRAQSRKSPAGEAEDRGLLVIKVPDHLPPDMTLDDAYAIAYGGKVAVVEDGEVLGEVRKFTGETFRDLIVHEMGHINRRPADHSETKAAAKAFAQELAALKHERFTHAANTVSQYAATNPDEFVAEAFTVLYNGGTLPLDTMRVYEALRGAKVR